MTLSSYCITCKKDRKSGKKGVTCLSLPMVEINVEERESCREIVEERERKMEKSDEKMMIG